MAAVRTGAGMLQSERCGGIQETDPSLQQMQHYALDHGPASSKDHSSWEVEQLSVSSNPSPELVVLGCSNLAPSSPRDSGLSAMTLQGSGLN